MSIQVADGNLNFNCLLVLMPPEILDSVVVHELCHRRYMNHSREFYEEVLRIFPDYKRCNKWLKQNGGAYFKRIIKRKKKSFTTQILICHKKDIEDYS